MSCSKITFVFGFIALLFGCSQNNSSPSQTPFVGPYSIFGSYQELPQWSGWCVVANDPAACKENLQSAVNNQRENSRVTVRGHGWGLWAAIATPIENSGYDPQTNSSTLFGTTDCWLTRESGTACSGVFPLWLTWPNTGSPYSAISVAKPNENKFTDTHSAFSEDSELNATLAPIAETSDVYANPTEKSTVFTATPTYNLPALAVSKNCGIPIDQAQDLIDATRWQALQAACEDAGYVGVICADDTSASFCDGSAFVNQGDVMIATESVSEEAWQTLQNNSLYGGSDTLLNLYKDNDGDKASNQVASWLPPEFISTKHMFWPVKGCNPNAKVGEEGCRVRYGALPPWVPARFKERNYATDTTYIGYETWGEVVAIDTCGDACPSSNSATLKLAHVDNANAITTKNPKVFPASAFVHLQISAETLENAFTAADRALLDQATIWAYGDESQGFEAGDFLVVAAMHIITKEIDTWAFNSIWWSPMDDTLEDCELGNVKNCYGQSQAYGAVSEYSGLNSTDIGKFDQQVGTQWRDYYVLTDSYGIRYELDGTPASALSYFDNPPDWATHRPDGESVEQLPVSMNVYIEPVSHPMGTNCQNCHRRAGVVSGSANREYAVGAGMTSYQTAQCPSLLADYGSPATNSCLTNPWISNDGAWSQQGDNHCIADPITGVLCDGNNAYPIVNTDTSWFIADGHVQKAAN